MIPLPLYDITYQQTTDEPYDFNVSDSEDADITLYQTVDGAASGKYSGCNVYKRMSIIVCR